MRVLDLGSHDGMIAGWLAREHGPGLHIDGVELDRQALATFNRRVGEAGATGEARYGRAEDAPTIFEPGTYDAVIAFEVLEHVPDMHALLGAAERMLKPGGRVYVSTPDGCYGDGNNPHHLRALRSIDVADLLRRRGRIEDMIVGHDTIVTAAYTPVPRVGEASIYLGPCWDKWSPTDIDTRGLGGSETAAVHLADQLTELGWTVTVYADVEECCFRQTIYRAHHVFDPMHPVDLLISSRNPVVFDRPVRARRRMLWLHDVDCGDLLTPARADRVDDVLVLSRWQQRHVTGRYPFLNGKVRRIRNGIDLSRFAGRPPGRRNRVLYTSSPDRGLDVLLDLWPQVREQVPDAELAYCYSPVYWRIAEGGQRPDITAHAARIKKLSEQPGVTALGSLPQGELARLMRGSRVWAHPSYNSPNDAPFHETSCIGAMEAQAAGVHVVASNWGALSETVKVGALVDGPPLSDRWKDAFVREIARGLTDLAVQDHAQQAGPKHARKLGWRPVAEQVTELAQR